MQIIIISEKDDISTQNVIEWLISSKIPYMRYNYQEFTAISKYISNDKNQDCVQKIWHRRYHQTFTPFQLLNTYFKPFLIREELTFVKFKEHSEKNIYYYGSIDQEIEHNKLIDLKLAVNYGLKIPETIITNQKASLIKFKDKYKKIITKPISENLRILKDDIMYLSPGTFLITDNDIEKLSHEFSISLFQQYIEKKIEIRTFYFGKKFFSMAIFSQNDVQTTIDYRNYNFANPNRYVPYILPKKIEKKIIALLRFKNINTCSIDLILNNYNEYIFLEINPQGQYDWLSKNCNYHIDKYISNILSNE